MQNGRMQIMHGHTVFDGFESELVRVAIRCSTANPTTGHPDCEAVMIVIAAVAANTRSQAKAAADKLPDPQGLDGKADVSDAPAGDSGQDPVKKILRKGVAKFGMDWERIKDQTRDRKLKQAMNYIDQAVREHREANGDFFARKL